MVMKKILCAGIAGLTFTFSLAAGTLLPSVTSAEIIELKDVEGRYPGGMKETPEEMQTQALERAKQAAAEQAGVYVESHTEVEQGIVTKDKIRSMAASVLEITSRDFRMVPLADGKTIEMICIISAKVDTDKINVKDLLSKVDQLEQIAARDKRIKELEVEAERLRAENSKLTSAAEQQRVQAQFTENRRQSLIAIYEKNLDIYDLGRQPNLTEMFDIARELTDLDPQNPAAFRAMAYYYRNRDEYREAVSYGEKLLAANPTPELAIEICTQLGSTYTFDLGDSQKALDYVNRGIVLARQKYRQSEIEDYVNGGQVEFEEFSLKGKSNTLRELYVLKSALEDTNPKAVKESVVRGMLLQRYRIYDIKYRTDWTGKEVRRAQALKILKSDAFQVMKNALSDKGGVFYVTGGGIAKYDVFLPNSSSAKIYAYQAAYLDAMQELSGVIDGVQVIPQDDTEITMVTGKIASGIAKQLAICGRTYDKYYGMEVLLTFSR